MVWGEAEWADLSAVRRLVMEERVDMNTYSSTLFPLDPFVVPRSSRNYRGPGHIRDGPKHNQRHGVMIDLFKYPSIHLLGFGPYLPS